MNVFWLLVLFAISQGLVKSILTILSALSMVTLMSIIIPLIWTPWPISCFKSEEHIAKNGLVSTNGSLLWLYAVVFDALSAFIQIVVFIVALGRFFLLLALLHHGWLGTMGLA